MRVLILPALLTLVACEPSLERQPRWSPYLASIYFTDESGVRPPVPGTQSYRRIAPAPPLTLATLQRGRQRYDIYCSACHGYAGFGDGLAVQRGAEAPPSFHNRPLKTEQIFAVETDGKDEMPSFASKLSEPDRWAVADYVRALIISEHFPASHLSSQDKDILDQGGS